MDTKQGSGANARARAAGEFDIIFVGLACFFDEGKSKVVLMPDGRTPPDGKYTPHFPYVVVDPRDVADDRDWPVGADGQGLKELGCYDVPKCVLHISGINTREPLVAPDHPAQVPSLAKADPANPVDIGSPNAVVRVTLSSGHLDALRSPDANPKKPEDAALVSRLRVKHEGEITVTAADDEGEITHRLKLKAASNVAIANVAFPDETIGTEHFTIYGFLTKSGTIANNPQMITATGIQDLDSDAHHIFGLNATINDGTAACGNQGCC